MIVPSWWDKEGGLSCSPGMLCLIKPDGSPEYPRGITFKSGSGVDRLKIRPIGERLYGPIPCWEIAFQSKTSSGRIKVNSMHLALMFYLNDYIDQGVDYQRAKEEISSDGARLLNDFKGEITLALEHSIIGRDQVAMEDTFFRMGDFLVITSPLVPGSVYFRLDTERCKMLKRLLDSRRLYRV